MRHAFSGMILLLGLVMASQARAQAPQPPIPTTVQLPTFRFFTVNTTVSVPDRGSAYLGGISGASEGSSKRGLGPLRSRAIGGGRSAGAMSVHATIIDHAELDRAVLAEAARRRGSVGTEGSLAEAEFLSAHVGRQNQPATNHRTPATTTSRVASVAEIRRQAAAQAAQRDSEIATWLAKAESLEAEGKPGVAKIYYQMITRRAVGDLKATASERIALINAAGSSATALRE